ncbi:ATP-binding protein [Dietzia psychralcaliphila]|uniref:ATP-binding protein n=1 Tax=Dietzia psychralcaliphila TaxID=139021 RepID=UPI000D4E3302|nr:ATP-binding protein [Dietzia psychralcaliphila]PTM85850.1 IstB-like ATP binding protein [Dietzia psychralcaliphila]
MSSIDSETKRKLREMGAQSLLEALEALEAQHDDHVVGMSFGERLQLVVDHAHESLNHSKIDELIRRANLRYPAADLRRVDLAEERGLDRAALAQLATCSFIQRQQNVVFQGFTQ